MIEVYTLAELENKLGNIIGKDHLTRFLERKRWYYYVVKNGIIIRITVSKDKLIYLFFNEKQNKLLIFVPNDKIKRNILLTLKNKKEINEIIYIFLSKVLNEYYKSLSTLSKAIIKERKRLFEEGSINFKLMEGILYKLDDLEDYIMILRDSSKLLLKDVNYLNLFSSETSQVLDEIKELREKIKFLMDLNIGIQQQKLNIRMEKLTIISTIFLPATLIASIYGMNFQMSVIPPWNHPLGFILALITIILASVLTYLFIKREYKKWK